MYTISKLKYPCPKCKELEWYPLNYELSLYTFNRKAQKNQHNLEICRKIPARSPHITVLPQWKNNNTQSICSGDKVLMEFCNIWLKYIN
jgi:hypothetical protein